MSKKIIKGDVDLGYLHLKQLPAGLLNDVHIDGDFSCRHNNLESLAGAPSSVSGGFYCSNNNLESLKGAPSSVGGDFYCHNNKLKSLAGAPSSVNGDFYCRNNDVKFTVAQVRAVCDVKGRILV